MFLTQLTFGTVDGNTANQDDLTDAAEWYLASLLKHGQIYGEYLYDWIGGTLTAYVHLPRPDALDERHHSEWSLDSLKKVENLFGHAPTAKVLSDNVPKRFPKWNRSSSFYLFTHAFDDTSPVCCGDSGKPVPLYLLPLTQQTIEDLYFWSRSYHNHDNLWLGSGALEIPAYKQLADPQSELSLNGRELCTEIETATGKPTFYFMNRYWGREEGEENRLCPGCGSKWRSKEKTSRGNPFHQFAFRCKRCRLVSHLASSDDEERYARIGEYKD